MPMKCIVFVVLAQCALTAVAEELRVPWGSELHTPWWSAAPSSEGAALSDAERHEALRRSIIALLHDPGSTDAWETFHAMERFIPRNRIVTSESKAGAVFTCGPPAQWPRFAVMACASTYVQFAEELTRAGMPTNGVRYREVAAMILIAHGAEAFAQKAPGCAEHFLSLSEEIQPFSSYDGSMQQNAYLILALVSRRLKNNLQAVEAYEQLGRIDALSDRDLSALRSIVSEAAINVSWDPETRILRTADHDDFFDAGPVEMHSNRIPYGMTSPDEDGATLVTALVMDSVNKTSFAAQIIDARLAAGNFELPVKVALERAKFLLGERDDDDVYFLERLRSMNDLIARAMQNVNDDVPEPTLIGFEIAKAIERIASRLVSHN